jgi:hypothetical protein
MGAFSAPLVALDLNYIWFFQYSKQFPELQPAFTRPTLDLKGIEKHKVACLRISLC